MAEDIKKARILIVEDEIIIAADLESRLRSLGYEVCGKTTAGDAALHLVERHRPDLVMMDIVLQGEMDGIDVAEVIRDTWGIPVVFLTAYADADRLERAKLTYPFGYILKPFQDRDLKITVEMALFAAKVDSDRTRVVDALRESEEKYRILLDESSDPIFSFYPDGTYRYVNRAFAVGVCKAVDEIIGKKIWDVFPREEAEKRFAALRRVFETGEGKVIEVRVPRKDGDLFFVTTINPVKNDKNEVMSVICSSKDITGRKRAEEALELALRESGRQTREMQLLLEGATAILEGHDFTITARRIFDTAREMTGARSGYVALLSASGDENEVLFLESGGLPCLVDPYLPMPVRGLRGEAYRTGRAVYDNDFMNGQWAAFMPAGHVALKNVMFAPLNIESKTVGIMGLANKPEDFTEDDRRMAEAFGQLAAIALKNSRTLEALKESDARHRDYITNSPYGIFVCDEKGRYIEVNPSTCQITGYGEQELLAMNLADLQCEDGLDKGLHHFQAGLHEGKAQGEFIFRHKSGQRRWWSVSTVNLSDTRFLFFCNDITARKQAEAALRESEERHRRLFESMTQGVVYQAANDEILSANPAAVRILGLSLEQMRGKTSMDPRWRAIREDGSELSGQEHPSMVALRTGKPVERFVMGVMKPQEDAHTWISVTAIPFFQAGETAPFQVYVTFDDITQQRRAEENYRTLFREMLDGFALHEIIRDENGNPADYRFLAVNPAFERMTGLRGADIVGKTVMQAIPDTEHYWIETYGKVALTGEPHFFENYHKGLDKFFEVTAFCPVRGQFACIFQDITERKRAEEEKEKLQKQLIQAQKMESVGTLAGGIAHDFNNILQAIIGYTQLLLMDKIESHPDSPALGAIQNAGTRAAQLVKQLLLFSRKTETTKKPLALNHEVEQAQKMLERTIPRMIDIELHLGRHLWTVKADSVQIEQVLLNLGANAADAMPDGGKLIIETANITLDEDYARNHIEVTPGSYVMLTVSDTGHGMDKETVQHIFEPFYTTKEIGKGTGLGLASVYGVVKGHGGWITCYSEPGQGTTFNIYLPALEQGGPQPGDGAPVGIPAGGTETILVVDDEEPVRTLASQILARFGYTVIRAQSGEEALEIYQSRQADIDLIMLDLGMPGMGGHKCFRELNRINPDIKVLIASGYSARSQLKATLESGAAGYVGKPYQFTELLHTVRAVLDDDPDLTLE